MENDKQLDKVINVAKKEIESPDLKEQKKALEIFKILAKNNKAFDEATKAALIGRVSADFYVSSGAQDILDILASKGKTPESKDFENIITIAKKRMDSSDREEQLNALKIFDFLVKNNSALDEAIKAALIGIVSPYGPAIFAAGDLLIFLASKGKIPESKDFENIITIAKKRMDSSDPKEQRTALLLFVNLVKNNRALDEAIKAASVGMASSDESVRYWAEEELLKIIEATKSATQSPKPV